LMVTHSVSINAPNTEIFFIIHSKVCWEFLKISKAVAPLLLERVGVRRD